MPRNQPNQIVLDEFQGSLDLLLHLVRRSEIPIEHLPLHTIMAQLIAAIDDKQGAIAEHTESLAPAATLLLLKSRYLLPTDDEAPSLESGNPSAPQELLQHIVDYCRFQRAAEQMSRREIEQAGQFRRHMRERLSPPPKSSSEGNHGLDHLALTDLVEIVQDALSRTPQKTTAVIEGDVWQVADAIERVRADLQRHPRIPLTTYFDPKRAREEIIVLFLAILEMMKTHELQVNEGVLIAP